MITLTYLYINPNNVSLEPILSLIQRIAPRPLVSCDLNKDSNDNIAIAREKKPDKKSSEIPKDLLS